MLNKPINNIVKSHFDAIYNKAKQKAELDYKLNITDKIKSLDDFEALKFHLVEKDRINDLIELDNHPYYIKNHSSENWLITQFASRYFLLGKDESKEFVNSVYLGEYRGKLIDYIHESEKKIPKYSFDKFLKGELCRYYFELKQTYNIEREDYYKILEWQSSNLINVVVYETTLLVSKYQEHLKSLENPLGFINQEFSIIEEELLPELKDADKLKGILSKLYMFKDFDFTVFDNDLLLSNYKLFHGDKVEFKRITPSSIGEVLKRLKRKPNTIISNEFTIFYTIENISFWLDDVIKGKSYKEIFSFPEWENILEEAINKGKSEADKIGEELTEYVYNSNHTKQEIKEYLIKRFEEYRHIFNAFEPKELFTLTKEEDRTALTSSFRVNCFFNNDSQKYKDDLSEAIRIEAVLWDIVGDYCNVFDTHKMYVKDDNTSYVDIMFLLHQMVLDKDTYNELEESLDDFMQHFHSFMLPYPVHFENQREKFAMLFHKGISRLQEVLDDAEPTKKILYLQSRLKELKQREFKFARIRELEHSQLREMKYPKLLKEFLNIEAEFIKETAIVAPLTYLPENPKILLDKPKIERFEELLSAEKQTYVLKMLEDLAITIDGYYALSPKKLGAIRGVVEALREKKIISHMGLHKLSVMFANKINATMKSELDESNTSEDYKKTAIEYIKNNPLH